MRPDTDVEGGVEERPTRTLHQAPAAIGTREEQPAVPFVGKETVRATTEWVDFSCCRAFLSPKLLELGYRKQRQGAVVDPNWLSSSVTRRPRKM